ncbi:hypothetical protein ACWEV3_40945 [Saccharopolyspora sp. NPDC003752]
MPDTTTTIPGQIIGYRKDGRPIRLQAGGSEDASAGEGPSTGTPTGSPAGSEQNPGGESKLGDAGKAAIDKERQAAKEARATAKAAQTELEAVRAELEKLQDATKSDQDKAMDKAAKDARTATVQEFHAHLVRAEARAVAAELGFHDPADAAQADLAGVKVGGDYAVDGASVRAAVEALLTSKPYLAKKNTASASDAGIGASGGSAAQHDVSPGLGRLRAAYADSATK